ncbi:MAG: iron uptake transporter deferrochelatase/peroxidase subunit [Acidimicrobiales bacterium]
MTSKNPASRDGAGAQEPHDRGISISRRQLLAGSGLASAALLAGGATSGVAAAATSGAPSPPADSSSTVPFHGAHQAGIVTPEQARMVFATYDLTAPDLAAVAALLTVWTDAATRLTAGEPLAGEGGSFAPPVDTGEAVGLGPSRLTLTVGFGTGLFDGRFGLASLRPAALAELPPFAGDQLDAGTSGGDLCVQACADDHQVAFHAIHNLSRLALGTATLRFVQSGFGRTAAPGAGQPTPRNLLGFHDGTANPDPSDDAAMRRIVWVDGGDQKWMVGGSYLVARRVRIHLEQWDRSTVEEQERTIGRMKVSGAPLGGTHEDQPVDLNALTADGGLVIPDSAHIRVASPATNGGQAILRRGYSFADGIDPVTGELDAGLFFVCFQKDPRAQFVPIQQRLSENDALDQYLVHTTSGVFACPPGVRPGESVGAGLL